MTGRSQRGLQACPFDSYWRCLSWRFLEETAHCGDSFAVCSWACPLFYVLSVLAYSIQDIIADRACFQLDLASDCICKNLAEIWRSWTGICKNLNVFISRLDLLQIHFDRHSDGYHNDDTPFSILCTTCVNLIFWLSWGFIVFARRRSAFPFSAS